MPKAFQLAPDKLWQAINPLTFFQQGAQFGFINLNLGNTQHPDVEQTILDQVGSYGEERDALVVLNGQLAQVRQIKEAALHRK